MRPVAVASRGRANKKSSLFPNKDDVCFEFRKILMGQENTADVFCSDSFVVLNHYKIFERV
mgnify:CR=1 FL=1